MTDFDPPAVAAEVLDALDRHRQFGPYTERFPGLAFDQVYPVTAALRALRSARGEKPVGRKIGFTNRTIWAEHGLDFPIWGDMYDTTVSPIGERAEISAGAFVEPRIEPEIVFKFAAPLEPGMNEDDILGATEWVAHGFEIVQSIFPGWRFKPIDGVAGAGLHAALLIGPPLRVVAGEANELARALGDFRVALLKNGSEVDRGTGANVLGSPLSALKHLVAILDRDRGNPPVAAGEIITTGTLTKAFPIAAGETWTTTIEGIALPGLTLKVV